MNYFFKKARNITALFAFSAIASYGFFVSAQATTNSPKKESALMVVLSQEEIDAIAATPSGSYAYFGSPSSMLQDLPYIKHNLKTKLSVPHLDELCTFIEQGKTVAPVKTVEFALQEAAECLMPAYTALAEQEITTIAKRLEEYYKKFETGEFNLHLNSASDFAEATTDKQDEVGVRRIQDRTSKTFRNIDVIRNTDTRYLAVARNAVIAGNLTVGGNQTIDGNLTVLGTINGSSGSGSSGNFVVNGGQTGPVTVGTTDATPLNLITAGSNALTIDGSGNTTIEGTLNLPGITTSGSAGTTALYIDGSNNVFSGPVPASGDVFQNGQPGPLLIGTNNAQPFTLEANDNHSLIIHATGGISMGGPISGDTLTVDGTQGTALVLSASSTVPSPALTIQGAAITTNIMTITGGIGANGAGLTIDVNLMTGPGLVVNGNASPAAQLNGAGTANTTPLQLTGLQSIAGTTLVVDISGNVGTLASSKRFKENFRPLEDASGIYKLKPTIFDFKPENSGEKDQIGFIAEEVKEIFPTMINHDKEGNVQSIRYDCFHALLVKELQEHRKALDVCEARLEAQSSLIDTLLNKIIELKK